MLNSTPRLSSIKDKVVLTQTDTTVGFLSQNGAKLANIKSRNSNKPFIRVYTSFKALNAANIRVPNRQKNRVRRMKKTTFIVKNRSFRVARPKLFSAVLRELTWCFSTSANEESKNFSRIFCEEKTDIIIEDRSTLYETTASKLYKVNNKKAVRLR